MITALLSGALVGLGAFVVARALLPRRPSLAMVLAQINATSTVEPVALRAPGPPWAARVGPGARRALERIGAGVGELGPDLAVLGRSVEEHMARRAAGAAAGIVGVGVLGALLSAGGGAPPVPWVALLAVGAALVGFALADRMARREAARRREAFRHSLAFFLDLVIVTAAGGAGLGSALGMAAAAGDGWSYRQIRAALREGRLRRESPWVVLGRLGVELGIEELEELAATVSLAEREGAAVRQSLLAKAASIRDHELSDAEAAASATTVRMVAPLVLIGLAFAGFVLYGAVSGLVAPG